MAGYSGTPLPKKLGLKNDFRIELFDIPAEVKAELKDALSTCRATKNNLDFAMLFVKKQPDLKKHFVRLAKNLAPAGMLWVCWPKKSSGVTTDLNENVVRDFGLDQGLVDVKVCAANDVWSGLKFVIRLENRKPVVKH